MAVFGAPIEQPDHADRAIAASREMLSERLPRFNAWLRENELGDGFRVGIGLNSGTVVSGTVGAERRLEHAAIGETTNIASRLQTMTKGQAYLLISPIRPGRRCGGTSTTSSSSMSYRSAAWSRSRYGRSWLRASLPSRLARCRPQLQALPTSPAREAASRPASERSARSAQADAEAVASKRDLRLLKTGVSRQTQESRPSQTEVWHGNA